MNQKFPEFLNKLTHLTRVDFSEIKKIKGKTLTNESLETCEYSPEATNLCIHKKIKYVEGYTFKTCEVPTLTAMAITIMAITMAMAITMVATMVMMMMITRLVHIL